MPVTHQTLLPVHLLLAQLEVWRRDPSHEASAGLAEAFAGLAEAYEVNGAFLALDAQPLPTLSLSAGSLVGNQPAADHPAPRRRLDISAGSRATANVWVDGDANNADRLTGALELAIGAAWAKQEAALRQDQLAALDGAVRGIAGLLSVERVLQLIVDRVRDLVGAQYAALGIVGPFGGIEQFITSGITREERARDRPAAARTRAARPDHPRGLVILD